MADLIQTDTDEEMDKYAEAELIAKNPPPVAAIKKKTLNYNPTTGRNDVLVGLSSGGYVKVGDEELPRVEQVQKYSRQLEGMPFDMADYEAAGFSAEEVQAAGVMPVEQEKTGRTEPLREGEELRILREGGDAAIAAPSRMFMRDDWNRGTVDVLSAIGVPEQQANQIADVVMGQVDTSGGTGLFDTGIGIIDFTPVGLAFGVEEIGNQLNRSIQEDDKLGIGAGMLFLALSAAEAYPLTKVGAKAVKAQIPAIRQAIADLGQSAEARIAERGDTTLFSNPVEPVVDQALAMAGRAAGEAKPSAAELRRQANIQRFGYDPNEAPADTSYRMEHQPTGPEGGEGIRLDDLTKNISGEQAGYPEDFYTPRGASLYAQGPSFPDDEYGMANQESYKIITSVRNNPDAEVTIYRAVPDEDAITTINPGDFVTLSRKYAELHGASGYGRSGDEAGKILEQKVKVRDIYWDGNDVNEFGYFPESSTATKSLPDMLEQKYPNVTLDISGNPEKGYELNRIVIPEGERGEGMGTEVMQDMIDMADEQGARIFLTPDVSFGGTSVARLKKFYKQFGFVENKGKNKDFSIRNTMYRDPQSTGGAD